MKRLVALTWVIFFLVACQQTVPTQKLEAQQEWVWWRGVSLAGENLLLILLVMVLCLELMVLIISIPFKQKLITSKLKE